MISILNIIICLRVFQNVRFETCFAAMPWNIIRLCSQLHKSTAIITLKLEHPYNIWLVDLHRIGERSYFLLRNRKNSKALFVRVGYSTLGYGRRQNLH